jgi:osmotically-inducible protein OsmY
MRLLIRALLVVILLVGGGFLLLGYWAGRHGSTAQPSTSPAIGTSGRIDTTKARERGAELGEKTAIAAAKAQETVAEAATTAKIKAKMALDEMVKARAIDVSTNHSTVTLSGTVGSEAERDRAVALARETAGVTQVVDHLTVQR